MDKFFRLPFAVTGDKTPVPDAAQPTGSVSYTEGFGADYEANPATDPDAKDVPRDETNQLFYDVTNAIREIQSFGAPDFITSALNGGTPFSYSQGARVKWSDGLVYESRINSNTTEPSNLANWGRVNILGFVASFLANGYLKIPAFDVSTNALREFIVQWGSGSTNASGVLSGSFPIEFPTACVGVITSDQENVASNVGYGGTTFTNSTFILTYARNGSAYNAAQVNWIAIGY